MNVDEFLAKIRKVCDDNGVCEYMFIMEKEDKTSAATWSVKQAHKKSSIRRAVKDYKKREHIEAL